MTPKRGKPSARSQTNRPTSYGTQDPGAAELGRRIADNLRERRRTLGLSLDDLARISGVSRAALSQIETCRTNPSLGVLWRVAVGLEIPFADLLGERKAETASLLRRREAQVLRSQDGTFETCPLTRAGAGPGVEAFEQRLDARATHASEPHADGTRKLVVVLAGTLRLTVGQESYLLGLGDSLVFEADAPHVYENPGPGPARYLDVVVVRR